MLILFSIQLNVVVSLLASILSIAFKQVLSLSTVRRTGKSAPCVWQPTHNHMQVVAQSAHQMSEDISELHDDLCSSGLRDDWITKKRRKKEVHGII